MPENFPDSEHELILENDQADRDLADLAIAKAILEGTDPVEAQQVFGVDPPTDYGLEEINRVLREVLSGADPAVPDSPGLARLRQKLEIEVPEMKKAGAVVAFLPEF